MKPTLNVSSSPHVRDRWTTPFIMMVVSLALLPAAAVGVYAYGLRALWIILASVISCVLTEFVFDKIAHRPDTWKDGSAVVTGLVLALTLSPAVPIYIPILGGIFAIFVVKCCFGGLGKNFMNPALAARCFLLISFGKAMTTFEIDGVSSATPMAILKAGKPVNVTEMFLGTSNGIIGSSILALLAGGLVLWVLDIIHGQICFSILISFVLFMGLFGGQGFDPMFLAAHLCGGGVVSGAFFMATDYTTSPVSRLGQTVYGVTIGVLGGIFRVFGSNADSFSYAIIMGNLLTPLIDLYIVPKPRAYRKNALAGLEEKEKKPFFKRIPKPVVALTLITLLAGLALSGVYTMTKDSIAAQKEAAKAKAYLVVCPGADHFNRTAGADAEIENLAGGVYGSSYGKVYINEAFAAVDKDEKVVGYAVSVTSGDGNDGDITLALGVSPDGTINGISFTKLSETPGLGMLADSDAFKGQFAGKNVSSFNLVKGGASADNEIDSLSGATVTSSAVVNAVNAGLDFINTYMK